LAVRSDERRFLFQHDGWEPTSDTRRQAEAGIRRAFERELTAYLDQIDVTATERCFALTPEKRTDAGFTWLARVIVDEDSRQEIANEVGKTRRAIEQAVRETAELVGIDAPHREN